MKKSCSWRRLRKNQNQIKKLHVRIPPWLFISQIIENTFFKCPLDVPRKTTVKSPVDVAATAVKRTLFMVQTGRPITASPPPNGVLTSRPQKSSPIVCNDCIIGKIKKKKLFYCCCYYLLLLFVEPSVGITVAGIQEQEKNFKTHKEQILKI
jgi:hypothetical protein